MPTASAWNSPAIYVAAPATPGSCAPSSVSCASTRTQIPRVPRGPAPPLPLRERDGVRGPAAHQTRDHAPAPPHTNTPADQSITETIRLALPIDAVWAALQDPALIAQCVPGARLTSATPDDLTGESQHRPRPDSRPFHRRRPRDLPPRPHRHAGRRGTGLNQQHPSARQRNVRPDRHLPRHQRPDPDRQLRAARPTGAARPRPDRPRLRRGAGRNRRPHLGGKATRHLTTRTHTAQHRTAGTAAPAPAAAAIPCAAPLAVAPLAAQLNVNHPE